MTMHSEPFDGAGQTFTIDAKGIDGTEIRVEDYWDRVAGQSWTVSNGNFAALQYAIRSGLHGLPMDDEVVYGKVNGLGHLVHVSEIGPNVEDGTR